jgi:hypothetical protein
MVLTRHSDGLVGILPADKEDDVSLGGVDIGVLQKEDLVDPILLQRGELDKDPRGAGERLLNHQVLLPLHLARG